MNSLYTLGVRQTSSLQSDLERLKNGDNSASLLGAYIPAECDMRGAGCPTFPKEYEVSMRPYIHTYFIAILSPVIVNCVEALSDF